MDRKFPKRRSQQVVVDGKHSSWTHVYSGVPQGTVVRPLLFPFTCKNICR